MQDLFYEIADHAVAQLRGEEVITLTFEGEQSDFVRFNKSKVRQPGTVMSRDLGIDLIRGQRHAEGHLVLSGAVAADRERVTAMLGELRGRLDALPDDPHLLYATEVNSTERGDKSELPARESVLAEVLQGGVGKDLVGILAMGPLYRGFANSLGQRNWFATHSFHLDWSFYLRADKAVKSSYAGFRWDPAVLRQKMQTAARQLDLLGREPRSIDPGKYRVYLSPTAVGEVLQTVAWMGFGLKEHRSKTSCLIKMTDGDATVDPSFSLSENTAGGIAPNFDGKGFIKADQVALIAQGKFTDALVSPRSSKEYGVPTNGAEADEFPRSLDLSPGELPQKEVLGKLDTGAYINNLWYLNYSDRPACRLTGMTRFATFWVEEGQIAAPLSVMRFDDSFYRMFGENLIGLTREREMLLDSETYGGRQASSMHLPGALIENLSFTL